LNILRDSEFVSDRYDKRILRDKMTSALHDWYNQGRFEIKTRQHITMHLPYNDREFILMMTMIHNLK